MTTWKKNPLIISWTHRSRELTNRGPTLLGYQSMGSPSPSQVAHMGNNLPEISSYDGGNQCNEYNDGGLINKDLGGHPPIPTGSKQSFGHFEGLNNVFSQSSTSIISKGSN
jgi:hypothetical protein